jgi:uncharacterized protein (TIGR02996 family)
MPMNHDDAFLQAILDAPDDDTPRLVYADWLEEYGQPDRAAFIRVLMNDNYTSRPATIRFPASQ